MFRFEVKHDSAGTLGLSMDADHALLIVWPRNVERREIAAAELEVAGITYNGTLTIIDREHPSNGTIST